MIRNRRHKMNFNVITGATDTCKTILLKETQTMWHKVILSMMEDQFYDEMKTDFHFRSFFPQKQVIKC